MNVKGTIPIARRRRRGRRRRYRRDPITPTPERLKMSLSPEKEIGLHPPTNPPTDPPTGGRTDGQSDRPAYRPAVIKNGERQQRQRERDFSLVCRVLGSSIGLAAAAETAW